MEPMKPVQPMEPMEPLSGGDVWWPEGLGEPSTVGGQDGLRYAYFADQRRLVVAADGETVTYDTGQRRIGGVQQGGSGKTPRFTDQDGTVDLGDLRRVEF